MCLLMVGIRFFLFLGFYCLVECLSYGGSLKNDDKYMDKNIDKRVKIVEWDERCLFLFLFYGCFRRNGGVFVSIRIFCFKIEFMLLK